MAWYNIDHILCANCGLSELTPLKYLTLGAIIPEGSQQILWCSACGALLGVWGDPISLGDYKVPKLSAINPFYKDNYS